MRTGCVVFKSSRHVTVLLEGKEWRCELRGRFRLEGTASPVVVGDQVDVENVGDGRGRVVEIHPRKNWLSRKRKVGEGRELVIASNIDQALAVFSVREPRLKFGTLDRLLVAAERQQIPAIVIVNKVDLEMDPQLADRLGDYPYPCLQVSATQGFGLDEFRDLVADRNSVMSGPSGVGKSSLLKTLLPDQDIRIGEVSRANEKGKHTTTAVRWYGLPDRGAIVDTPGFREYALWDLRSGELGSFFPEVRSVPPCRFSNCLHRAEPGCRVKEAVTAEQIPALRYRGYLALLGALENDAGGPEPRIQP